MSRKVGERLTNGARRRAIRQLQSLVAAGVSDDEARDQVSQSFDVSRRTASYWLAVAYREMAKDADVGRDQLLGTALRRRRLVMARAAKDADWRTYLAAADSEAKLLGLNAPIQTEHHVVLSKVQDMSRAVVDVVRDFFADDPAQQARFVQALRARLNAQLAARPAKDVLVLEAEAVAAFEPGEAPDPRVAHDADDALSAAQPAGEQPLG